MGYDSIETIAKTTNEDYTIGLDSINNIRHESIDLVTISKVSID